jgi:hypothetical protein
MINMHEHMEHPKKTVGRENAYHCAESGELQIYRKQLRFLAARTTLGQSASAFQRCEAFLCRCIERNQSRWPGGLLLSCTCRSQDPGGSFFLLDLTHAKAARPTRTAGGRRPSMPHRGLGSRARNATTPTRTRSTGTPRSRVQNRPAASRRWQSAAAVSPHGNKTGRGFFLAHLLGPIHSPGSLPPACLPVAFRPCLG